MTVRGCTPVGNKGGLDLGMDSEDRGFLGSSIFKG